MSHDHASSESHGFHPHILPLKVYILVGLSLFILTGVTIGVAQIDLGSVGNLIIAISVATVKASLVALFFMHLLYDNKLYMIVFLASLLFLGVFITITLFDTERRGDLDANRIEVREHPTIEGMVNPKAHGDPHASGHGDSHSDSHSEQAASHDEADAETGEHAEKSGEPTEAPATEDQAEPEPAH